MTAQPTTSTVDAVLAEHAELELRLADPAVHADAATARKLAAEDPGFGAEADELAARIPVLESRLAQLLVPRDPHDGDDVLMEVKSGEGGEESALFAGDLVRMYTRLADRRGWKVEVLDAIGSDLGGYKDITLSVRSREPVVD